MNILCVLARVPVPGEGKTRLRSQLGDTTTDRLTAAFVADVLDWAGSAADGLLVAHRGDAALLPPMGAGHALVAQAAGDLGARIAAAVDAAFDRGATRVVIVGTDCPSLPAALVEAAFSGLEGAGSTLVPAADGGWVALGVRDRLRSALQGVAWSSPTAGAETAAALARDGRPPLLLPAWYDVDEPPDLERLRRDPSAAARAPRSHASVREIAVAGP